MDGTAISLPAKPDPLIGFSSMVGRCFMHPLIDYALIGGGITIPIFLAIYFFPGITPDNQQITLRSFLLINGAHFAASTLRLYTKPGAKEEFPFLSFGFPVICLLTVGLALSWPALSSNLTALYFTWSPYHYAAQTYGLAVMYAMRSGARLDAQEKAQIWWVCLIPFLYALLTSTQGGLAWFVSREWLATQPALWAAYQGLVGLATVGIFVLPISLFWQLHRMRKKNVPLICLLLQVTNGIWWLGTDYLSAWWWTAMLHSVQYLLIVAVLHAREQMARTDVNHQLHRPLFYASAFYGMSFVIAAFLFFVLPLAYVGLGFDATQSFIMMTVVINLHHFIVDGFIWRTKPVPPRPVSTPPQGQVPVAV